MAFGQDAKFSLEALVTRINADLANNLGNLVSRVLAMQQKYFDGVVQPLGPTWAPEDEELRNKFVSAEKELARHMAELQFHRALESVWGAIDHANRYVVQTSPFTLFKDADKRPGWAKSCIISWKPYGPLRGYSLHFFRIPSKSCARSSRSMRRMQLIAPPGDDALPQATKSTAPKFSSRASKHRPTSSERSHERAIQFGTDR